MMKKMRLLLPAALTAIGAYLSAAPLTSGLVNLGNTCFMNATLQALAHVPEFVATVEQQKQQVLPAVLHATFNGMLHTQAVYTPDGLVEILRTTREGNGGGFGLNLSGRQEDAQEFLNELLNKVFPQGPLGTIFDIGTQISTTYKDAIGNQHDHVRDEPPLFMLQLGWEPATAFTRLPNLLSRYFVEEDPAQGTHFCDQEQHWVDGYIPNPHKVKRSLVRSPLCFVVLLQRGKLGEKDKRPIHIPDEGLRLPGSTDTYDLCAVVVHDGYAFNAGHYYAFARNLQAGADHAWYLYNDAATPKKINWATMHTWLNPKASSDATPYVLFYRKRALDFAPSYGYQGGDEYGYAAQLSTFQKDALKQEAMYKALEKYMAEKMLHVGFMTAEDIQGAIDGLGQALDVETVRSYDLAPHLKASGHNDLQSLIPLVKPDPVADVMVLSATIVSNNQDQAPTMLWQQILTVEKTHYLALAAILKDASGAYSYVTDDIASLLSPGVHVAQKPVLVVYYKIDGARQRMGYVQRTLQYLPAFVQKLSAWFWKS